MDVNDSIIEIAESGREATDDEIQRIRTHVATVGFEPGRTTKAGVDVGGMVWQGRQLQSNDWIDNSVAHFLRHAVARSEWPRGTTFGEYIASLSRTIGDTDGGIALEKRFGQWQLSFIAPARDVVMARYNQWILVGYPVNYGYWATGFRPDLGLQHFTLNEAEGERWLRQPLSQTGSTAS